MSKRVQETRGMLSGEFASDMGWPPGHWPQYFDLDGHRWRRMTSIIDAPSGEFAGYVYESDTAGYKQIWND